MITVIYRCHIKLSNRFLGKAGSSWSSLSDEKTPPRSDSHTGVPFGGTRGRATIKIAFAAPSPLKLASGTEAGIRGEKGVVVGAGPGH
jgi:hypothetical protein